MKVDDCGGAGGQPKVAPMADTVAIGAAVEQASSGADAPPVPPYNPFASARDAGLPPRWAAATPVAQSGHDSDADDLVQGRPGRRADLDAAAQARLSSSLMAQLDSLRQDVRDTQIFHFISHQDRHTVGDLRRAAAWVAGHPQGIGQVSPRGLDERWPEEMDRLPKLAIALGLERLKLSGVLGMPMFEHEQTGELVGRLRVHLQTCLTHDGLPLARLQERLMRDLVGATGPRPSPALKSLRLSVEALALRPRHNQRDYVAMAIELALD